MITVEELRFFVTLAEHPSLAATARALDVTPPAITHRLRHLEEKLSVRLVDRSARHVRLTDEGELFAQRGRAILEDVDRLAEDIETRRGVVAGHLRIVAPLGFGRRYVAPAVAAFAAAHPAVTVTLALSDNPPGPATDQWDVLIHVGELRDSSLIVHRLAPNERFACASPDYVRTHGAPESPDDLTRHSVLALRQNDEDVTLWRFSARGRKPAAVRITPRMSSNDGECVRIWALAGLGIIVRSEWDTAADLKSGQLVRVLDDYRLPKADIVALLGARHGRAARTSALLEHLRKALTPVPWRPR